MHSACVQRRQRSSNLSVIASLLWHAHGSACLRFTPCGQTNLQLLAVAFVTIKMPLRRNGCTTALQAQQHLNYGTKRGQIRQRNARNGCASQD